MPVSASVSESKERAQEGERVRMQGESQGRRESAKEKWMRWRERAAGTSSEKKAPTLTRRVMVSLEVRQLSASENAGGAVEMGMWSQGRGLVDE